jgi:hypothetical protein
MNQYIGQITVILESDTPAQASETLCVLAKQLDDTGSDVVFADHNGEVEDYEKIEQECEDSLITPAMTSIDQILTGIAKQHLGIATLEARSSDSLDFHDVSVWGVKNALGHAYQAGMDAAPEQPGLIQKQLTSNGMFHTPGVFRALQNDFRISGKPRQQAIKTLSNGYGLSREEAAGLLSGAITSEIDDAAGTVTFTSRCGESPADNDREQNPYSVLLLYPDYADDTGYETYYALVEAANVDEAVAAARREAAAAQEGIEIEPFDFHPLLVTSGHHDSEALFNK